MVTSAGSRAYSQLYFRIISMNTWRYAYTRTPCFMFPRVRNASYAPILYTIYSSGALALALALVGIVKSKRLQTHS